jgi:hypothetical protein
MQVSSAPFALYILACKCLPVVPLFYLVFLVRSWLLRKVAFGKQRVHRGVQVQSRWQLLLRDNCRYKINGMNAAGCDATINSFIRGQGEIANYYEAEIKPRQRNAGWENNK